MSKTFIVNGTIIDPSQDHSKKGVLVIEGGKILAIEESVDIPKDFDGEVFDADGKWIIPGLIDAHVHLREPGQEWKETILSGSKAAIAGGYTSIMCMPNTTPAIHSAEIVEFVLKKGREANLARILPIGAVSLSRKGEQIAPLLELAEAGCVAFSDDGDPVWDAGLMRRALQISASLNMPICCHEEDCSITHGGTGSTNGGVMDECGHSFRLGYKGMPAVAEEVMIARDIELARETGGHAHICHVSTARGALLIERAKQDGIKVTAEVTPHHLHLTHDDVDGIDTHYKMSPPLRAAEDVEALRDALSTGVIDMIASDHAPHERDSKECEFESATMGITGLQTNLSLTLQLVNDGVISKERAIDALSTQAAQLIGVDTGSFKKGAPADVVTIDPKGKWELDEKSNCSKSVNTPFWNQEMPGGVDTVFVDGECKLRDGKFVESIVHKKVANQ